MIDEFRDQPILVIGDAMLDGYYRGTSERLCQEAPVPVIAVSLEEKFPGGAANTAANLAALGARVTFLSVLGQDERGFELAGLLRQRGVDSDHLLFQAGRRTLTKMRVVASQQILVRLDQGDTSPASADVETRLIERLERLYPWHAGVVLSDYGYGNLTPRVIEALARLQARYHKVLVADARELSKFRGLEVTAAKPNYREALRLLDQEPAGNRCRQIVEHAECLLDRTGARILAVTLDTDGAVVLERGQAPHRTFTRAIPQSQASGAGDTFVSALTLGLVCGRSAAEAADLAAAAANVVVLKDGTALCTARELEDFLASQEKTEDREHLARRLDEYRAQGKRIVFTNGCFDILHRGHVTYLKRAKALGDVLVVGVNTDASIQRLKGPNRPINPLEDRLQVLAALGCVDHLIAFGENTPCELLKVVRPNVFVKGGDYTRDRLPEAALVESMGGEIKILPFLDARSTTGIIERIHRTSPAPLGLERVLS